MIIITANNYLGCCEQGCKRRKPLMEKWETSTIMHIAVLFYQTIITKIQISIVNDRDHLELDIYVCKQQQCFLRILCNLIT